MNSPQTPRNIETPAASHAATRDGSNRPQSDASRSGRIRALARSRRELISNNDGALVAVVGMAGRFPGAASIEAFWNNLANGVESIHFFTREEYEAAGVPGAILEHPNFVPARGVLEDVEAFDAAFFGYSPREAELLDPQQRIFLECAWEALERAGCDPERYDGPIGVFAGQSLDRYMMNVSSRRDLINMVGGNLIGLGMGSDYLPLRVSYKLNLRGPSFNVQAGCSTSLIAVHVACRALQEYECDMALAGGVSVMHPRFGGYLYQDGSLLSPDGHVRVFDATAGGTVFSEGVGVVTLKRLKDALADGDHIHAVILGSASNNDGFEKASFTSPSAASQAELVTFAQTVAGVAPESIGYMEMHGTATVVGDPIEAQALCEVFKGVGRARLAVGSVKTNIGHMDQAAGIAGFIKTVLTLEHRQIPPSLNFRQPNPAIDFDSAPFYVNTELTDWKSPDGTPRRAGVSGFGVGGSNAHIILEEPPAVPEPGSSRDWQLLVVSAKSRKALEASTARLQGYLDREGARVSLADVAYTLQSGRRQFEQRRAVLCRSAQEAVAALGAPDGRRRVSASVKKDEQPALVLMFPGQGTQYPNMGRELYESEPVFARTVADCCEQLRAHLAFDLRTLLFPLQGGEEEAAARLKQTSLTQPALFVIEYALARLWMSWGLRPTAMIGHSIGEYVAACVSGVLALSDALRLVSVRGRAMEQAPGGVMLSLPLTEEQTLRYTGDGVWLAAVNAESACVVSGTETAIAALEQRLGAEEVASQRLETSHAFHSGLLDGAMEPLAKAAGGIEPGHAAVPYVSNLTGDWIDEARAPDASYWASHMREPVRFHRGIATVLARHPRCVFLEVGPGHALSRLVKMNRGRDVTAVSSLRGPREDIDNGESMARALGSLWVAGVPVDWQAYSLGQQRRKVVLPTYPFERTKYWVAMAQDERTPRSSGILKTSEVARWFYQPYWQPALVPRVLAGEAMPKRWLILGEDGALLGAIRSALCAAGAEVVSVRAAAGFEAAAELEFGVSPSSAEDFGRLVRTLRARGWTPEVAVHAWGLTAADTDAEPVDGYDRACLDRCFYSLLWLTQALAREMADAEVRLEVLADGVQQVADHDPVNPLKGVVTGLCLVIAQELPTLTCRHIDVGCEPNDALRAATARHLLSEMSCAPTASNVAYRSARRWVRRYQPAELAAPASGALPLRERGLYLITGGLGNLGLTIADSLVDACKARLLLTGRTGLPPRGEWNDEAAPWRKDVRIDVRVRLVQDFERRGGEVLVAAVDTIDAAAMAQMIERAERQWGPLRGVIHAAGVMSGNGFRGVQALRAEDCEELFGPKIRGTLALTEALGTRNLDFCMLLSSLSVVLGGLGNGAYASANAYLDAFAASRRSDAGTTRWITVNWDQWGFQGDQAPQDSALARLAMTPQEGIDAHCRILATEELAHVVVSTADLEARLAQWVNPALRRRSEEEREGADGDQLHERPELNSDYVDPRNEVEAQIAQVWAALLAIERVGVNDNFIDLGGHSLLAAQLLARLRGKFHVEFTLDDVFRRPTVAEQAQLVAERSTAAGAMASDSSLMDRLTTMSDAERKALLEEARRSRDEVQ